MYGFLTEHLWWLTIGSVMLFAIGLGAVVAMAIGVPADYFVRHRGRPNMLRNRHPIIRIALRIGKNIAGACFLMLGIIMALPLVPGPGILLVLLGVSLLDVPGKGRLERFIISRPLVLRPINALRAKWGRQALIVG